MVTGAAGDDQHLPHTAQQVFAFGAEDAWLDAARGAEHFEGVCQRHRLLEDFLLHVVPVVAQFDRLCRQA
ncbi:MAG: hypothetical protein AW07_00773 [Candidatus Accumulibacter sp. SK-11]|nr:MAG: hypothetical protein AW07_00773 [Candidatus Accumulibacter sp. SK-11]